jgi:hypothetical protein
LVFQIFNCGAPGYLCDIFDFLNSRYYTGNWGINLRLPPCYSSIYKSSFTLAANSIQFNSKFIFFCYAWALDAATRALETFSKFKNIMKNNLKVTSFWSLRQVS